MTATLDWMGCATFRLTLDELVIFLDAYIDRVPNARPIGITVDEIDRADWIVVGHSHFDHLYGAERIACATGATVIGSYETVRIMEVQGGPEPIDASRRWGNDSPWPRCHRQRVSQSALLRVVPEGEHF